MTPVISAKAGILSLIIKPPEGETTNNVRQRNAKRPKQYF